MSQIIPSSTVTRDRCRDCPHPVEAHGGVNAPDRHCYRCGCLGYFSDRRWQQFLQELRNFDAWATPEQREQVLTIILDTTVQQ